MEGHEYTIIQQAREQNRERKRIQKEIQKLHDEQQQQALTAGDDVSRGGNARSTYAVTDTTSPNAHDDESIVHQHELDQRKASLEARHKELQVHVPLSLNTTVSNNQAGSKLHGAKFQLYDQQQLYLKKKQLRVVIVCLCAALNFGNQFVGNGPAPLQTEIQAHMGISDAQFNIYFSIKSLASLLPPLLLAFVMGRFSLRGILLTLSFCCMLGQMFFAIGLSDKDHNLCILGRLLIGVSDALTIFQQSIMCIWFPASQLPFAFGILLFLQKIVRTANDNVASLFYEATAGPLEPGQVSVSSLVMYQWIGFAICLISTICSLLLAQIHESVIDDNSNSEVKEKQKELKRKSKEDGKVDAETSEDSDDGKQASIRQLLTKSIILYMVINATGYASIHSFYPNMSKFFQVRFDYTNVQAGCFSSLPYLIASFSVPFLGSFIGYLGEQYFEIMLFGSIAMVLTVHVAYLSLSDVTDSSQAGWAPILPLLPFGLGHALFTTMQAPTVPKLVKNKNHLARVFTYIKITESVGITLAIYMAGYIREQTQSFTGVSLMMAISAICSMVASFFLMQDTKAVGSQMFNVAVMKETFTMLKVQVQKFFHEVFMRNSKAMEASEQMEKVSDNDSSDSSPGKAKVSGKRSAIVEIESI